MTVKLGIGNQYLAPVWLKQQDPSASGFLYDEDTWIDNIRIPKLRMGANGVLVAACELRRGNTDGANAGIGVRLSSNGGRTWSAPSLELAFIPSGEAYEMNLSALTPPLSDGTIFILYSYTQTATTAKVFEIHSDGDDYTTWSAPTEISSSVVKVSNAGPPTVPATLQGTDDNWEEFIVTGSVVKDDDTLICTGFYRYTIGTDLSNMACITRAANGTWSITGGLEGGGFNENEIVRLSNGNLRLVGRRKQISALYTTTSTDDGATWAAESTTGLALDEVHPSLINHPSAPDTVYLSASHDTIRTSMTIFKSTDGGATWPTSRVIFDGRSSYSSIACLDANRLLLHFEAANNYADYIYEYQMVKQAILNVSDLDEPQTGIWHAFNERSSGAMSPGPSVPCHAGSDVRAFGNTSWTYTSSGATTNGSGLTLDAGRTSSAKGSAWGSRSGSFTAQVVITDAGQITGGGTTQQLMGDRSTGAGWAVTVAASTGILTGTLHDGTTSAVTCTHGTDIRSGTHSIAFVRDVVSDQIYLVVDGVEGTKVTDTQTAAIPATANAAILGSQPNGSTNPVASGVVFQGVRFDRKVVATADLLASDTTKRTLEQVAGYNVGTLPDGSPSLRSSCKIWLAQFADPLRGISADAFDPFGPVYLPPDRGQGVVGLVNPFDRVLLTAVGTTRNHVVDSDATVGRHLRARQSDGGAGATLSTASAYTGLDFMQNSGTFTLVLTFRIDESTGAGQFLAHTNGGSGSAVPGFYLVYTSSGLLNFVLTDGAARITGTKLSTKEFTVGTWYTVAFRASGPSSNVTMKWTEWSGSGAIPSSWTTETWGTITTGVKTSVATLPLYLSGRSPNVQNARWSYKELTVDDVVLSDAQVEAQLGNYFYDPPGSFSGGLLPLQHRRRG